MHFVDRFRLYISIFVIVAISFAFEGCIKNDIPYPRIEQKILAIAADGESKEAYIDSIAFEVHVYLDETVDITKVRFNKYEISPDGVSDPDLLVGDYDLSSTLLVTLSRFQDYTWEIKAVQDIERYFQVSGEVGQSVVDPTGHRVVVTMPEGTDLSHHTLEKVKLGPVGITTMSPDLKPGIIDLTHPMRVEVTAHGRTEIWTIYAQITETIVSTTQVDAWSKDIWAYGNGPSGVNNGFEYRKTSESEWHAVPEECITRDQGTFSCYIPHLEPLTEYAVRTVSGENYGNQVIVKTQAVADLPDGDFEQWSKTEKGMWNPWDVNGERFWDTGNQGSMTIGINLTTPTDHTATGSGTAAKCESKFVSLFGIGKLGSGSIFTGEYVKTDGTNGILAFGRKWDLRPTRLKGFMQYDCVDINYAQSEYADYKGRPDSCHIYVALTDWTAPYEIRTNPAKRNLFDKNAAYVIAYGELTFSGHQTDYQPFDIKLNYKSTSRVPAYLQITCTASKYGDYFTGGAGSVLYVDQFYFDWDY